MPAPPPPEGFWKPPAAEARHHRKQNIMAGKKHTVDLTTTVGTFSFPRLFASTKGTKDDGSDSYDIQILIPKSDVRGCRAIMAAIKEVGVAAYGDPQWKRVKIPFRDGDKEADNLATDGTLNREKYPERLGHYFFNARSSKPVGVFDRARNAINNPDEIYGGAKGKIAVTVYPYNSSGNVGIGMSLNGVQKTMDGESFGGGKPAVESMFDVLEDEDDVDLMADEAPEPEATLAPAKPAAKKAAAKKAAAPKAEPEPEPVEVTDEDDDLLPDDADEGAGDEYDDL